MVTENIVIANPSGLHARPASMLIELAKQFSSTVEIVKGEKKANAASIMSVLALGAATGDEVAVEQPQSQRHALYEIVEYIGRWSMIDVFVVAILSSLVQLNTLASVTPGPASLFFALSVIFTMLSAQSFDSRLIWDLESDAQKGSGL